MNCRRENEQSTERATAFASIVFPTPGKSSMIRCPSPTRQSTARRSVSSGACTTRPTLAATAASSSARAARRARLATRVHSAPARSRPAPPPRSAAFGARGTSRRPSPERMTTSFSSLSNPTPFATHRCRRSGRAVCARACRPRARARPRPPRRRSRPAPARSGGARRARAGRRSWARARATSRRRPSAASPSSALGRPVVGDGGGHDHHVRVRPGERLALHVRRGRRLDDVDARRRRHREVGGEQRDVRAAAARLLGEGDAHAPGRAVADEADGVDRLARPARADEHPLALNRLVASLEEWAHRSKISSGSAMRPAPHSPSASSPSLRADELDAPLAQQRDVRLRGRVLPHADVHRRRDDERPAVRERRLGERGCRPARARASRSCSPSRARRPEVGALRCR